VSGLLATLIVVVVEKEIFLGKRFAWRRHAVVTASLCGIVAVVIGLSTWASEFVLPIPSRHFNDYAHAVSSGTAAELNQQLDQFQHTTGSELIVVVYPQTESEASIQDYTTRVAKSWGVGEFGKINSAVLFVFVKDRAASLQVGSGLERALPEGGARDTIESDINSHLQNGDLEGGVRAGVMTILHAIETSKPSVVLPSRPIAPAVSGKSQVNVVPAAAAADVSLAINQTRTISSLPPPVDNTAIPPVVPGTNQAMVSPVGRGAIVSSTTNRSGTASVDPSKAAFDAYDQVVIKKVQRHWYSLIKRYGTSGKTGTVTVEFQLSEEGAIKGVKTTELTGNKILESLSERAVRESAPFEPLPKDLQRLTDRKPRDVEMTFQY
jgi:TonB family protein